MGWTIGKFAKWWNYRLQNTILRKRWQCFRTPYEWNALFIKEISKIHLVQHISGGQNWSWFWTIGIYQCNNFRRWYKTLYIFSKFHLLIICFLLLGKILKKESASVYISKLTLKLIIKDRVGLRILVNDCSKRYWLIMVFFYFFLLGFWNVKFSVILISY